MEENEKQNERVRIQLELSPAMAAKLQDLVELAGLGTRADVLRRAISVFAVLLEEEKAGNRVELVGPGTERKRLLVT